MAAARGVQRWTVRRYLPVTDWDSGGRNSVTTGIGYVGVCVAVLCALAATGLGFNQIALVASALSVGIGFGGSPGHGAPSYRGLLIASPKFDAPIKATFAALQNCAHRLSPVAATLM